MKIVSSSARVLAAAAVLMLIGAGCGKSAPAPSASAPTLTREDAMALLKDDVRDCEPDGVEEQYRSCALIIVQAPGAATATVSVTHDGFFDDSVKASRVEAAFVWRDGAWSRTSIVTTNQCWPGRGHQDFSEELCV